MGTRQLKLLAIACLTVVCAETLVGCATSSTNLKIEETKMTDPNGAKDELHDLYEATKDLIGGQWVEDTRGWGACSAAGGGAGVAFSLFAMRPRQPLRAEPSAVAKEVRALWEKNGRTIKDITYNDVMEPPRYIVSDPGWLAGSAPDGSLYQVTVGEDHASFTATSRCVPGDGEGLSDDW